jgi:hypothetical protein
MDIRRFIARSGEKRSPEYNFKGVTITHKTSHLKPTPPGFYLEQILTPGSGFDIPPDTTRANPVILTNSSGTLVNVWKEGDGTIQVERI